MRPRQAKRASYGMTDPNDQLTDGEPDDEARDEDRDEMREDDLPRDQVPERAITAKCWSCEGGVKMLPPTGYSFQTAEDDDESDDAVKSPRLRFTCSRCGSVNVIRDLKKHRLVTADVAAAYFSATYARQAGVADADDDGDAGDGEAAKVFREGYLRAVDRDDWRRACTQYGR